MMADLPERFQRDGYASPIRVMAEVEAAEFVRGIERAEQKVGRHVFSKLNAKAHLVFPAFWDLVMDHRIVGHVKQILGQDVLCWGTSFFSKAAGSEDVVPWHQDGTCWGLDRPMGLTAWVALTPSTPESGCLRVVPRTHRSAVTHAVRSAPSSMLPLGEEIVEDVDEASAVDCILQPGEMSLHHVMVVHGSARNRHGTGRRIGFAIRYIAGDVRQRGTEMGYAALVSGRDHGNYLLEKRPDAELDPTALRLQREILRHSARLVQQEAALLKHQPR